MLWTLSPLLVFEHSAFFGQKSCTKMTRRLILEYLCTMGTFLGKVYMLQIIRDLYSNIGECHLLHKKSAKSNSNVVCSTATIKNPF